MVSIRVPGSKSYTNRALVLAAQYQSETRICGALRSDDTERMIECLKDLGISIREDDDDLIVIGGTLRRPERELFCGNAGTVIRFLTALCAVCGIECTLTGDARMLKRPIADLARALRQLGADIETTGGQPPVHVSGKASGDECTIKADISSQFVSALMLAAPHIRLHIDGTVSSKPYIAMTRHMIELFSAQKPASVKQILIEGDASAATYFWALSKLLGKKITVSNVPDDSLQGDALFKRLVEHFKPGVFDMNNMPDSVPTLAVFAAFQKGETRIINVRNLRMKESDRIAALSEGLRAMGCEAEEFDDGLLIHGDPSSLHTATIETYDDHRIAMSFALAKAKIPDMVILNPECVSKTYPGFWTDLDKALAS